MSRRGLKCEGAECGGHLSFYRCSGDMTCAACGRLYYDHPFCANSRVPERFQSSTLFPDYILHVLCNGDHVKT